MVGYIKDTTGSPTLGLYVIATSLFVGGFLVLGFAKKTKST
jgi:hypothetical protein